MFTLRVMTINDYEAVIDLMKRTPGVTFRDADSYDATRRYLDRNPGLSFIATTGSETVGCIMSGHDGRRGYLQHLVVLPEHQHGRSLLPIRPTGLAKGRCLSELNRHGAGLQCLRDTTTAFQLQPYR
jgi:hypothetical protein